jgi:hypothetical protein
MIAIGSVAREITVPDREQEAAEYPSAGQRHDEDEAARRRLQGRDLLFVVLRASCRFLITL